LTGSLSWGLVVPWSGLALTALGGSLLTVVCSLWPVRRALAVAPLEALSPTLSAPTTRRLSLARIIVCGLVGVAGGALVALGVSRGEMLASVGGAALVSVAVLVGTPLFVPPLVGALGRLAARRGIGRVAAANIVRDPGRSSVTAAALAMTVGLVVTILVGGASAKTTFLGELERNYPVDVAVYSAPPVDFVDTLAALPADLPATLGAIDGVAASATLPGVQGTVAEYRGT
ncbi:MAG TPA: ABC transporter permease, partial [Propionibacteriaceae bacterium]|nr:ABC transporter permease [Propionibacteriaceae bacterium]